jgi:hypothetical protein
MLDATLVDLTCDVIRVPRQVGEKRAFSPEHVIKMHCSLFRSLQLNQMYQEYTS